MSFAYFAAMKTFRAYAILAILLLFLAYFGVYGFYATVVDSIGEVWALAGAGLIAIGTLIVGTVGFTMVKSMPPQIDTAPED
jgi:hypothetical protein